MTFGSRPIRVRVTHFDANDDPIAHEHSSFATTLNYLHRQTIVVAPQDAVAMELVLLAEPGPGPVFVDDVRLIDDSLLVNGGFEVRPRNGRDDESPGWRFEAGGARVVTDEVRSGTRAVALEGIATELRQVSQEIRELAGATQCRVTAWLKTVDVSEPPTISARFDVGGNLIVSQQVSDGAWRRVGGVIDVPPGAQRLSVRVRIERGTTGTTYLDDVLVVPVGPGDV